METGGQGDAVLTLAGMGPHHLEQVVKLRVADEDKRFVGGIDEILERVNAEVHPHVILVDDQVVGFFLVDTAYGRNYAFAGLESLGLRAYFIDRAFQGLGYGKRSIRSLSAYLGSVYPDKEEIFLTVNCQNPIARHCYLAGGFVDSNELYLAGKAGPQHIMSLKITQVAQQERRVRW
ncbi:GNAT family N-acetyltransferase [Endothiovibrio diazotrophicus]